MLTLVLVGAGGFLGAIARYLVSGWVQNSTSSFPWGTLAVNFIGCILIGLLMGITENRQWFSPEIRALALIGVLGGFTTFSTFSYETLGFIDEGAWLMASANVLANVVPGIIAVFLGMLLSRTLLGGT